MRLLLASAGIALLASSASATAADCTKGLLWPYVRHPGDCLTDAEIQAGKTGAYTGPATGQVDVSTIKPPPQLNAASTNAIQCSHSWYWPFGTGDCEAAPGAAASSPAGSGATASSPAAKDNPPVALPTAQPVSPAAAAKPQAAASPAVPPIAESVQQQRVAKPQAAVASSAAGTRVAEANTAECHKGILWPFVRDAGDCPTAAESGRGTTSTVPTAEGTPAATPASAPSASPPVQPVATVSPATEAACTKGTFWPFIRESGDCPTIAGKASGTTPAAPSAATEAVAMPPAPAPAMQPAAVANPSTPAACTKGTFWPFIRASGDCATAAERANGTTPAAPSAATEAVAMSAAVAPPSPPAPAMQPAVVANPSTPAGCMKGTFWPFIRGAGDCPTAAEKANDKPSPVQINASAPATGPVAIPAVATMPDKAAPAQSSRPPETDPVTCHKGLLWPFVREAGDCPTGADKGPQHNAF